jgi:hypothetical protein
MTEDVGKRTSDAGTEGTTSSRPPEAEPATPPDDHAPPTCTVGFCPICLAVTAMQPLRPDAIEHLLVAGREFFLAAKAVLDARAEQFAGDNKDRIHLEKIDIG